jgi:lysophospholipase L1-like esterase
MSNNIAFTIILVSAVFLSSCCSRSACRVDSSSDNQNKSCCVINTEPEPLRILCFGDSITQGVAAQFQGGYRGPLKKLLDQESIQTDFVGTEGLGDASPNLPDPQHEGDSGRRLSKTTPESINEIFSKNTDLDIVIILIGINDLIENRNTVDTAISLISRFLDLIAQNAPDAKIYVGNLIPNAADDPVNQYDPLTKYINSEDKVVEFNKILPVVVKEKRLNGMKTKVVDLHSRLSIYDLHDGIHPNVQGYNKIAQAWFQAITAGN